MKKSNSLLSVLIIILAVVLSSCSSTTSKEKTHIEEVEIPVEYVGKTNPLANNPDAIVSGKSVYESNCLVCHGKTGAGDGPAGASLDPKPGDLGEVAENDNADEIFWRVSDGGMYAPFNSSMPAWKGVLSEDKRWQVVSYIKTLNR